MKVYIETFVDIILIAIFSMVLVQFLSAHIQIENAQSYHKNMIERIESSDCNASVIQDCITDSTNKYGNGSLEVVDCTTYEEHKSYYVKLTYDVSLPLMGRTKTYTMEGYAR